MTGSPQYKPGFGDFRVAPVQGGFWVVDEEGRAASPVTQSRQQAVRWAEEKSEARARKRKQGPRACLCCGATFESQGIHNRLCATCRAMPGDALQPQRPSLPPRKRA